MTERKEEKHYERKNRWDLKILRQKLRLIYLFRSLMLGDVLDSDHSLDCLEFITICGTVMLYLQVYWKVYELLKANYYNLSKGYHKVTPYDRSHMGGFMVEVASEGVRGNKKRRRRLRVGV